MIRIVKELIEVVFMSLIRYFDINMLLGLEENWPELICAVLFSFVFGEEERDHFWLLFF
jgi:hypothetical protein